MGLNTVGVSYVLMRIAGLVNCTSSIMDNQSRGRGLLRTALKLQHSGSIKWHESNWSSA